jgi:hypothetical protein
MKRKIWLWLGISLSGIIILSIGGFVIWANQAAQPMPEALEAMESNELVEVVSEPWFIFTPAEAQPEIGIIFYPGGRVDARAYAPSAQALAQQGILVVITPMPLNLAVLAPGKASEVIDHFPEVDTWIIGGHSLGGSMAAQYASGNLGTIDGLMFWASYPAQSTNLSTTGLSVISIYATNDGLATPEKVLASEPLLPSSTNWTVIDGGNHAQFGWYGEQAGDGAATISRQEQQDQVVDAVIIWILPKTNP